MTKSKNAQKTAGQARARVTKKDQLIKLLRTRAGADVAAISTKLGWQQHTTRAALSGLRKAGYGIAGEKPTKGGSSKYRIIADPVVAPAEGAAANAG